MNEKGRKGVSKYMSEEERKGRRERESVGNKSEEISS